MSKYHFNIYITSDIHRPEQVSHQLTYCTDMKL